MTAPEPTPTAERIDAVARHLPYIVPWERLTEGSRNDYRRKARRIMDDPSVHEALAANLPADVMLAALVRAGVLTEDRERLVRACGCIANEEPAACCDPLASPHWERRYVTSWQVVTLRAKVAAVEAKRDEFADLLARALPAVAALARVEALCDSNPDHADTCGSMLTPGAGYPCSCWQADLRAALATTGEGE